MFKWIGSGLLLVTFSYSVAAFEVETTFSKTCAICHVPGVALAPKIGDEQAWRPRMAQGMDAMVQTVISGKGAMPPKGMCSECTEEQFAALIQHMLPK